MVYTDDYLQSLRQVTDPLSDQAVAKMFQEGNLDQVNAVFRSLIRNDGIPEFEDYDISQYLQETCKLPPAIDQGKVEIASQVFLQYGSTMFLILFCKALPECYSCKKGAEVLAQTGKLASQADDFERYARRLMETAQFLVNVLEEGSLSPTGKGIVSAQKIRLVHATIRHYLRQNGWNEQEFDAPINQEDLMGTLLSFSVTIIEGLDLLGAHLTNEQREGYYYMWTIIGQLMGLVPEHIPSTYVEAAQLKQRILDHQSSPSQAGEILTQAAIDYMAHMIPGEGFDSFPEQLMLFLLDPKIATAVGLKKDDSLGGKIAVDLLKVSTDVQSAIGDTRLFQSAAKVYEVKMMDAIFKHFNQEKQIQFYVPPSLKAFWTSQTLGAQKTLGVTAMAMAATKVSFPAADCHEVVPQLERIIGRCKVENNAIGFFASLYRLTTLKIVKAVDAGIFDDNERMARMDLVFARRYLDAVTAYFNQEKTSAAWEVAFSVAKDPKVNVMQQLLLGMNAHINLDLAVAAAQIAPGNEIHSFQQDFMRINEILKSLMDLTAHDIADIWPPLKGMLMVGEWAGKPLAGLLMVKERDNAWAKAQLLASLSGAELQAAIEKMDQEAAQLGEEVVHPGLLLKPLFWAITEGQKGSVSWQIEQFDAASAEA